ncbi:Dymeclin [Gongronella butleri]|nr:Dymeclin [Gongronella butleri]
MSPISPVPDTNKDALVPDQLPILQKITDDPRPTTEHLLDTVLKLLIDLDPSANYNTYEFYVELLNLMVVLFSTQMHHSPNAAPNLFLDLLLTKFADRANAIVAKLLDIVIEQKGPPAQSSSMVFSAYNYLFASRSSAADADTLPVADRSLLVILLLCTQSHLYRRTIASLRNLQLLSSDLEDHDPTHLISYKALFNIFCQSIHVEEHMLLFYLLLIENESFRVYVLSRTDPETIYIPILKMIYESIEQRTNFSQIYILMVILLIFSQDEVNNDTMQKVMVSNIPWFTERPLLRSVSLGSLTMLVLIRVLQFNLSHQKDIYFHTNCLAILANMAGSTLDMHSYVAQRLTGVFELIARRYQKWSAKLMSKEDDVAMTPTTDGGASDDGSASSVTTPPPAASAMPALPVDMTVYEDLLMLMLEIMNAVLTHRLMHNAQLVYCLLLKRDLFKSLHLQPRFAPVVSNIDTVINYFHVRVAEAQLKSPSSTEVLALIEQAARTWPANRLQPLPDLKFQYEEDQDCHQFFVPYVWALIHRRTYMYWSEDTSHVLDTYRLVQEPAASTSTPLSPPQA